MATQEVDARGLPCPQPVLKTSQAMRQGRDVLTIVDNETAQKNVTRMAEKAGATVGVERRDDGIYLHILLGDEPQPRTEPVAGAESFGSGIVLVVPGEQMGRGDDVELGEILVRTFFHALGEVEPMPDTMIFFNSAVRLTVTGSPVVEDLRMLVEDGVEILACGTCLDHYGLNDKVAVGTVSNMYTIAETMLRAGRLVYL